MDNGVFIFKPIASELQRMGDPHPILNPSKTHTQERHSLLSTLVIPFHTVIPYGLGAGMRVTSPIGITTWESARLWNENPVHSQRERSRSTTQQIPALA